MIIDNTLLHSIQANLTSFISLPPPISLAKRPAMLQVTEIPSSIAISSVQLSSTQHFTISPHILHSIKFTSEKLGESHEIFIKDLLLNKALQLPSLIMNPQNDYEKYSLLQEENENDPKWMQVCPNRFVKNAIKRVNFVLAKGANKKITEVVVDFSLIHGFLKIHLYVENWILNDTGFPFCICSSAAGSKSFTELAPIKRTWRKKDESASRSYHKAWGEEEEEECVMRGVKGIKEEKFGLKSLITPTKKKTGLQMSGQKSVGTPLSAGPKTTGSSSIPSASKSGCCITKLDFSLIDKYDICNIGYLAGGDCSRWLYLPNRTEMSKFSFDLSRKLQDPIILTEGSSKCELIPIIHYLPEPFGHTKLITFHPRYIMRNSLEIPVIVSQAKCPNIPSYFLRLLPNEEKIFTFPDHRKPKEVSIRSDNYLDSCLFSLSSQTDYTCVKLIKESDKSWILVCILITEESGIFTITFAKPLINPTIRVRNHMLR